MFIFSFPRRIPIHIFSPYSRMDVQEYIYTPRASGLVFQHDLDKLKSKIELSILIIQASEASPATSRMPKNAKGHTVLEYFQVYLTTYDLYTFSIRENSRMFKVVRAIIQAPDSSVEFDIRRGILIVAYRLNT